MKLTNAKKELKEKIKFFKKARMPEELILKNPTIIELEKEIKKLEGGR